MEYFKERIEEGIYCTSLNGLPFKRNSISINCFVKLDEKTSSQYAILPFLLKKRTKKINSLTKMGVALMNLYGASLSANCRKVGDNQVLTLSISVLDDDYALEGENLTERGFDLLMEVLLNPYLEDGNFNNQDINIEKENLIELMNSEFNDKRIYAINNAISEMCKGTPFSLNKYGDVEKIRKLTPVQIKEAYDNLIRYSNIQIIAITKKENRFDIKKVKEQFKNLHRENIYCLENKPFRGTDKQSEVVKTQKIEQAKLVMTFKAPLKNKDECFSLMMLNYIFGGTPISKLFMNVREKLSLCYYCASRFDRTKEILIVDSGVENKNIKKAEKEILSQLNQIKEGKISNELFEQSKLAILNLLKSVYDSPDALDSFYITQTANHIDNSPKNEMEKIKEVNLKNVIEVSKNVEHKLTYILKGDENE